MLYSNEIVKIVNLKGERESLVVAHADCRRVRKREWDMTSKNEVRRNTYTRRFNDFGVHAGRL